MPAREVTRALKAGELDDLLAGHDPGAPLKDEPLARDSVELGARGQLLTRREELRRMSPERVREELRAGRLDDLLRGREGRP